MSAINHLFNKKYSFSNTSTYELPDASEIFTSEPWVEERFEFLKDYLNSQKSRLNDYDLNIWQQHTYRTNPAKDISRTIKSSIRPELFTVAWAKFYEIACNYDIIPQDAKNNDKLNSLHLCEAPGAFITSLNHFLKLNHKNMVWNWKGTTLNPYYEGNSLSSMICDDRLIKNTLDNWDFGPDYTGNIMKWENSQSIIENCKTMGNIHLITADGSIDCSSKPEEQETVVASLHFCEVITALQALCEGGTLILKMFTLYEHTSINLLYILVNYFQSVNLFKPVTSKSGNSEIYVICLNYSGIKHENIFTQSFKPQYGSKDFLDKSLFPRLSIPKIFFDNVFEAAELFCYFQCEMIDNNISVFENPSTQRKVFKNINKLQKAVTNNFLILSQLKEIDDKDKICNGSSYINKNGIFHYHTVQFGSFTERRHSLITTNISKLEKYREDLLNLQEHFDVLPQIIDCSSLQKPSLLYKYGAPILKLNSSRFIFTQIFKIHKELHDYASEYPCIVNLEKVENNCIIEFKETKSENSVDKQEKIILDIFKDALALLDLDGTLILKNYNLLTQFNAGLLYLLGAIGFEKIDFSECSIIELINLKNKVDIVDIINTLCAENFTAESSNEIDNDENETILGIIHLKYLLCDPFYSVLFNYNNYHYFLRVSSKIDEIIVNINLDN